MGLHYGLEISIQSPPKMKKSEGGLLQAHRVEI